MHQLTSSSQSWESIHTKIKPNYRGRSVHDNKKEQEVQQMGLFHTLLTGIRKHPQLTAWSMLLKTQTDKTGKDYKWTKFWKSSWIVAAITCGLGCYALALTCHSTIILWDRINHLTKSRLAIYFKYKTCKKIKKINKVECTWEWEGEKQRCFCEECLCPDAPSNHKPVGDD